MTATLDSLQPGQSATVTGISGDDGIAVRLMEMGVIEGETIRMIGRAPLGDPIEYEIRGYRLSLRTGEAGRVEISADVSG